MSSLPRDLAGRPYLRTSYLIPNLHCPTCVTNIEALVGDLDPSPVIVNISIIDHIVTLQHDASISAFYISEILTSAGYEVFDVILDQRSRQKRPFPKRSVTQLERAIQRWDPRQNRVDEAARAQHDAHCTSCAEHKHDGPASESDSASDGEDDGRPRGYVAVLSIEGMTCSSCVGNVTRALKEVSVVDRADVALVSHSANVHFKASKPDGVVAQLIEAVEDSGYDAKLHDLEPDHETPEIPSDEKEPKWRVVYSIEGMSCSSCTGKVTETLQALDFVDEVDVNLVGHSGTIVFNGKDNEPRILEAIEDLGYEATQTEFVSQARRGTDASRTASLQIKGMHCSQCPKRVLAAMEEFPVRVEKKPSLDNPVLTVTYVPSPPSLTIRSIMGALADIDQAFDVSIYHPSSLEERSRQMLAKERRSILIRAIFSAVMAIPTLIIGIVYMNLVSPDDSGYKYLMYPLHGVSRAEWATFAMATPIYLFATDYFHRRMIKEVTALWRPRSPVPILKRFYRFGSMNMLISLGTTIAYAASLTELIISASNPSSDLKEGSRQSYFDSVVFLTLFILIGRLAEAHMKAKSGDAVSALGRLRPTEANLVIESPGGAFSVEKVGADLVDVGDVVKVPHGSSPPCDGALLDDVANLDESSLTGESRPVQKGKGETVYSGTINQGAAISLRVTGPAGVSMLDSIIQVVREGQAKRAPMERVADLLTAYFVPFIVAIAIVTWIVWLALGVSGTLPEDYLDNDIGGWPFWSLQFAIAVFVIACPCGLGLAAPTALFVGGGMAAKRGILAKGGGEAFQEASNMDVVVFDKTGTLTEGAQPKIVEHTILDSISGMERAQVLGIFKGVEENSSHPLARAAVDFATAQGAAAIRVSSADEVAGKGLKAAFEIQEGGLKGKHETLVGNESLMRDWGVEIPREAFDKLEAWKSSGFSVILLACRVSDQWKLAGVFAAADPIRDEAAFVVHSLQKQGVDVWMLSGDNPTTAQAVGSQIGIPPRNIIAGVLPTKKAEKVRELQESLVPKRRRSLMSRLTSSRKRATIAMVGDGINDAPALAAADVGIAVASGSDVAVQSAAFVLVHSDLRAVLTLVTLSRAVFRRVLLNFFWAAIYNLIALPIAAGVLYPVTSTSGTHVRLDPAWAALAMALSSITVVGSSLLLRTRLPLVGFKDHRIAARTGKGKRSGRAADPAEGHDIV